MLADTERVDSDALGQFGLGDDVAQHLRLRSRCTGSVDRQIAKGIEAEFKHVINAISEDLM